MIDQFLYGLIEKEWKFRNRKIAFLDIVLIFFATLFACLIRSGLFSFIPDKEIMYTGNLLSAYMMSKGTDQIFLFKVITIIFDFVSAIIGALLVYQETKNSRKTVLTYTVLLFLPTLLMNSLMFHAGDSIYISFILLSVYLTGRIHPFWGLISYGIAIMINPLALVLLPFYIFLLGKKRVKWHHFLLPLLINILYALWIVKWTPINHLTTLSDLYPNIYQIIGTSSYVQEYVKAGILLSIFMMLVLLVYINKRNFVLTDELQIRMCLFLTMFVMYFLPGMHAKDGLLLTVLSIIVAFNDLRRFPIPFILIGSSFASCTAYLTQSTMVPLYVYSALDFIVLIYLGISIFRSLHEDEQNVSTAQERKAEKEISQEKGFRGISIQNLLLLILMTCLGLGIRFVLRHVESMDYQVCLKPWVYEFKRIGSFHAIAGDFYNYTPPYMYLIYLISLIPREPLYFIKAISIIFDLILSIITAVIVWTMTGNKERAYIAYGIVFCLPTVAVNSGLWGQCDVIYVTFIIASLYFILKEHPQLSMLCFGMAFALKLQTLFVFPLYFFLWTRRKLKLWHFFYIPFVYLICCIPSGLAGKSWKDMLLVYVAQGNTEPWMLSWNWPNIYLLFGPNNFFEHYSKAGVIGTIAILMISLYYLVVKYKKVDQDLIIRGMLFFSLIVPFFLPYMHERYGYLADILVVIYAFYKPHKFYLAVLEIIISFTAYTGYLNGASALPQTIYCFIMLFMVIAITIQLFIPDWELQILHSNMNKTDK